MRFLVIGTGAREHALCWKLAQEAEVFATPGNPGMASCVRDVFDVPVMDIPGQVELAKNLRPDCIVVGPEDPLIAGLADALRGEGFNVFGPGREEAQLEGSKAFAKQMMARAGVPTAGCQVFTDPQSALDHVAALYGEGRQAAVKASGAALGKGVVVAETLEEAREAIQMMMVAKDLGSAGDEVVIEDRLIGREFSLLTVVSGTSRWSLPIAQDHKRIGEGDAGPNTGGMGAYSPVSWVSDELLKQTEEEVVDRLLAQLGKEGRDFRGCLFSGLLVQEGTAFCLEYNVRFGDPECQTVLRRLGGGFADLLLTASQGGSLSPLPVSPDPVVTLSLCSGGYPGPYAKGIPITIGALPQGALVFHAGTKVGPDGSLVTNGGRVLSVTGQGQTMAEAREIAYSAADQAAFEGKTLRRDIALLR